MRRKRKSLTPDTPLAPVPSEILDQFVRQGPISHEELEAAVRRFKKAIIERALGGELTHHLGYPPRGTKPEDSTNHRNGTGSKTVLTEDGPLAIEVPRDREGSFEPHYIPKHERRFTGFDDKILALYARGCQDILIAVTDGLKGMSEALAAVYPQTTLQTCIVHLIRHSLDFANWKERKPMATALRPIYAAASADAAAAALDAFERGPWGPKFPTVVAAWRRAWMPIIPFFAFPPEIRRLIYTTNALESVHAQLRKIIKTRGHFPNDEAATKLIWWALRNITAKWERTSHHWRAAMNQFAILYDDRFPPSPA